MCMYKCPECGWVGVEDEMLKDFTPFSDLEDPERETTHFKCPQCNFYLGAMYPDEDYIII